MAVVSPDGQTQDLGAQIGSRVRFHRQQRGISGVKLASAAGISQPFLSQLESGQTSVAERMSSHVLFNVDAHTNTTRAVYSVVCSDTASSTRTPVARFRSRS